MDFYARIKHRQGRTWYERLLQRYPAVLDYAASRWRRDPYLLAGAVIIHIRDSDTEDGTTKTESYYFCTEVEIDENRLSFYSVNGPQGTSLPLPLPGEDYYDLCTRAANQPGCNIMLVIKPLPMAGDVIHVGYFEYGNATKRVVVQHGVNEEVDAPVVEHGDEKVVTHQRFNRRVEEPKNE